MSVGGVVVHVESIGNGVSRIYTRESQPMTAEMTCVNCRNGEKIRPGDSVWWQCGKVYWTPAGYNLHYRATDFPLSKVGSSYCRGLPK